MKNFYLSLICAVTSISAFAQDTIYMDKDHQELKSKENAEFYKIITPAPNEDHEFLRTTYFINGTKKIIQFYNLKGEKKVYEGLHKHYYESGKLFFTIEFKKGKMHGELIAFWENGVKRRHDVFKRNKLKDGKIWDKNGKEIEYFHFEIPPEFPGGKKALTSYLQENAKLPSNHTSTQRVVIEYTIDTLGNTTNIKIIEHALPEYMLEAYRLIDEMPKWKPGKQFGEPKEAVYRIPILFQK